MYFYWYVLAYMQIYMQKDGSFWGFFSINWLENVKLIYLFLEAEHM